MFLCHKLSDGPASQLVIDVAQVDGVADVRGDIEGRLLTVQASKSVPVRTLMEAVRRVVWVARLPL